MKLTTVLIWISIVMGIAQTYTDDRRRQAGLSDMRIRLAVERNVTTVSDCRLRQVIHKGRTEAGRLWLLAAQEEEAIL